jgi:hypothetical protein
MFRSSTTIIRQSHYMCFAKVIRVIISNQLKYVVYRISSVYWLHIYPVLIGVCVCVCVCVQCTVQSETL